MPTFAASPITRDDAFFLLSFSPIAKSFRSFFSAMFRTFIPPVAALPAASCFASKNSVLFVSTFFFPLLAVHQSAKRIHGHRRLTRAVGTNRAGVGNTRMKPIITDSCRAIREIKELSCAQ
jgi:hypothetical protein